jgi:hypothetical protein
MMCTFVKLPTNGLLYATITAISIENIMFTKIQFSISLSNIKVESLVRVNMPLYQHLLPDLDYDLIDCEFVKYSMII